MAAVVVVVAEAVQVPRLGALAAVAVPGLAGFVARWAGAAAAVPVRAAVPGPGPVAVREALAGRQPSEEAEPAA